MWVLGIKPRAPGRAASALKLPSQSFSPQSELLSTKTISLVDILQLTRIETELQKSESKVCTSRDLPTTMVVWFFVCILAGGTVYVLSFMA